MKSKKIQRIQVAAVTLLVIAGLINYLASDVAGFMTGANLAINGGQHMM